MHQMKRARGWIDRTQPVLRAGPVPAIEFLGDDLPLGTYEERLRAARRAEWVPSEAGGQPLGARMTPGRSGLS
jgi:hypothetical protein